MGQEASRDATNLDHPQTEMHEIIDGVLLRDRELRVLEKSSPVLVGDSVLVEDIESNDPDFVEATGLSTRRAMSLKDKRQKTKG